MKTKAVLEVRKGDPLGTMREFLGKLLHREIVDALLVPAEEGENGGVTARLIEEPAQLETANPFVPVLPSDAVVRAAEISRSVSSRRVGAVMRSCETRLVIELDKMGRAQREALTLIGVDCLGTYEPSYYADLVAARGASDEVTIESLHWAAQGQISPYRFRMACQMCDAPIPDSVDIDIGLIGVNPQQRILVTADKQLVKRLGLSDADGEEQTEVKNWLLNVREKRRDKVLNSVWNTISDASNLLSWFSTCTACLDCTEACPIYEAVRHSSEAALEVSAQSALPEAKLLGQFIGFSHWMAACVGCGLCESVCPAKLPLTPFFRALGERVQERLEYVPGRNLSAPLPWTRPLAGDR